LAPSVSRSDESSLSTADRTQLATYARDTWRSIEAASSVGVLPTDHLVRGQMGWESATYTSPTDIAAYLWSTLAADSLKLISHDQAGERLAKTLTALGRVERSNGFFYNWYDPQTGERLKTWPGGAAVRPFLSSVDNGWLAAALMMIANVRSELRPLTKPLLEP